jgi:hypothetical protein
MPVNTAIAPDVFGRYIRLMFHETKANTHPFISKKTLIVRIYRIETF